MEIRGDIEAAIHAHSAWKTRFRDFLSGKEGMDLSEIPHTGVCDLGIWLEGTGRRLLPPEDHEAVCKQHAHFHQVAGELVSRIKQKDFRGARQMIASRGTFDQASLDLVCLLRKVVAHNPTGGKTG